VAPLERCKILYQTGRLHHTGILPTMKSIVDHEGAKGLFKGNGASTLRIIPYSAIHFGLYEHYRRHFVKMRYGHEDDVQVPIHISPIIDLLAGSASGATAVLITYPLDFVRTRLAYISEAGSIPVEKDATHSTRTVMEQALQSKNSLNRVRHETIRTVLQDSLRREGLRGLYHGIGPSMYGILPYAGLKFFVYQHLKQLYWIHGDSRDLTVMDPHDAKQQRLSVPIMLSFGAIAGLVAQTATYPVDVVRRRMQVEGLKIMEGSHQDILPRSTPAALLRIAQLEGWGALFSGLSINYMKVIPSTAIGFTLYDFLKSYLFLSTNL
jgi:hypothetical protein